MKRYLVKAISVISAFSMAFSVCTAGISLSAEEVSEISITNSYDETNASYIKKEYTDSEGTGQGKYYSSRTVGNNTIEYFAYYDTTIEESPNGTNAVLFGDNQRNEIGANGDNFPNQVRIYDSSADDLAVFTPKANTQYTVSINYYLADNFSLYRQNSR